MRLIFVSAVACLSLLVSDAGAQNPTTNSQGHPRFVLSDVDERLVKEFNGAWKQCVLGAKDIEAVVLLLRDPNGSVRAVSAGHSNQAYAFTFKWRPDITAIFHTHPNNRDPKPQPQDIQIARRYGVPVFTLTSRGMYSYDPATDRVTRIKSGTEWLESSNWLTKQQLAALESPRQ
jgi:hypothetical protein